MVAKDQVVHFSHTRWHRVYVYGALVLLVAFSGVLLYVALFVSLKDATQWIPLLGMLVISGGYTIFMCRHLGVPTRAYLASAEGVSVQHSGRIVAEIKWVDVVEVKKYSPLTGMGFVRSASPPAKHFFLNVLGEANDFAEFAIRRCMEVHGR